MSTRRYLRVYLDGTPIGSIDQTPQGALGFAYDDECFSYTMTMTTKRDLRKEREDERSIGFNISFRTLGDFGSATSEFMEP